MAIEIVETSMEFPQRDLVIVRHAVDILNLNRQMGRQMLRAGRMIDEALGNELLTPRNRLFLRPSVELKIEEKVHDVEEFIKGGDYHAHPTLSRYWRKNYKFWRCGTIFFYGQGS